MVLTVKIALVAQKHHVLAMEPAREKGRELVMESVVVTVDTKEIFAMNAKMDILKALTVHVKNVIGHVKARAQRQDQRDAMIVKTAGPTAKMKAVSM